MVISSERALAELGWRPRCPTNVSVLERFKRVAPRCIDPRIPLFLWSVAAAVDRGLTTAEVGGFDSRIHLRLDGPSGGDFGIAVEGRRIRVGWGAPRPPTATVALDASLFLDLLAGREDAASAQLTGRLRIHGEGHAGLVVSGMISGFRAAASSPGARGRASRAMGWLFARGGT
jgi:putative sterol carrier protein